MRTSIYFLGVFMAMRCLPIHASPEAEPSFQFDTILWRADNGQNSGWLWGPVLETKMDTAWAVEAKYLQGHFNQGGDLEENDEALLVIENVVAPFRFGIGFSYLGYRNELRQGFVWSYPEEQQERNADIYGPVLRTRMLQQLFDSRFNWFGSLLIMPYDMGDLDDLGFNGRYIEGAAGVNGQWNRITMTAGYRIRYFDDTPNRIINDTVYSSQTIQGFFAGIGFSF